MPSIEFPCLSFLHPLLGVQYRPYAFLELYHQNRMVQQNFLVDSGADVSVIPYQAGLDLGLPLHMNDKIYTLGGGSVGLPVVYRPLQMQIGPYRIDVRVAWALSAKAPTILGRLDVFDEFNVDFRQSGHTRKAGHFYICPALRAAASQSIDHHSAMRIERRTCFSIYSNSST